MHFITDLAFILNPNNGHSLQPMFELMNLRKLRVCSEVGAYINVRLQFEESVH